jgi:amino acid transporter
MAGGIPVTMLFGNGAGTPALFLIASVILCVFSIGYTAMAVHVRSAGAFYAFATAGLGVRAGAATGVIALLSYNTMQISLYGLFGSAVDSLIAPLLGVHLPWWCYALVAMGSIGFFGYRRVDLSARVLGVLVACEYLVVLVLDIAIAVRGGAHGLSAQPFSAEVVTGGAPWLGLLLCFSSFIGFEATTIYCEEARNPARTVPLATYLSVTLIGVFYTASTWSAVIGAGVAETPQLLRQAGDPTSFLFSLSDRYGGSALTMTMRILFVTSVYASLLAFHNCIARYVFAMGRDRILPARLSHTHARFQSPHVGSLAQTAAAFVCVAAFAAAGADPVLTLFTLFSAVGTLGIIVLMAVTSLAVTCFFVRRRELRWRRLAAPAAALVALSGVAVFAARHFEVLAGGPSWAARLLPFLIPAAAFVGIALQSRSRAP